MKHFVENSLQQDLDLVDRKTNLRSSVDINIIVNTITSLGLRGSKKYFQN